LWQNRGILTGVPPGTCLRKAALLWGISHEGAIMTAPKPAGGAPAVDRPMLDAARIDDTSEYTADEDPMTEGQTAILQRLAEEALEPEAFSRRLSSGEAQRRIEALRAKLRLQDGPPHTL